MTMKTKKTLQHIAAVAVVLLTLSLVFAVPVSAETLYYVSPSGTTIPDESNLLSPSNLSSVLNEIKTGTDTQYVVLLMDGEYTENYVIEKINNNDDVSITLKAYDKADVKINKTLTIKSIRKDAVVGSGTIILENLKFSDISDDYAIVIPRSVKNPGTLILESCEFSNSFGGITVKQDNRLKIVKVLNTTFTDVSYAMGGYYNYANEFIVSGCEITGAISGMNIQTATMGPITIKDNSISAQGFCVRVGNDNTVSNDVIITGNKLSVIDTSGSESGAVVFRGKSVNDVTVNDNIMEGSVLLNFGPLSDSVNGDVNLDDNYWNGENPVVTDSSLINWGNAVTNNQKPESVVYYTSLTDEGEIDTGSVAIVNEALLRSAIAAGGIVNVAGDITLTGLPIIINTEVIIIADNEVRITTNVVDVFTADTNGKLTLGNNININSDSHGILWAINGGEIVVDGANLKSTDTLGVTAAASIDSTITILSGIIESTGNSAVCASGDGAVVAIMGGEVKTMAVDSTLDKPYVAAFSKLGGHVEVTDGTIISNGAGLCACAGSTVKMSGGTVTGVTAHEDANAKATITGGTINGPVSTECWREDCVAGTMTITGGTFSVNPSAYIPSDYEVVQPGNSYLVQKYVDRSSSSSYNPVEPEEPVEPEVPVEPEIPEEPVNPENPVEPEIPEDPEQPEEPETPETPESPAPILAVLAGLGAAVVLRRK